MLPPDGWGRLTSALKDAGVPGLDQESYHTLRVEAGQPAVGSELSEEYSPLETGLSSAISGNKGCYTGQEVIARQITYDKVTRQLAGLRLEALVEPGDSLRMADEDRTVGEITSVAWSPRFGPIALAIIRRPYHFPGTRLRLGGQARDRQAIVIALPFQS